MINIIKAIQGYELYIIIGMAAVIILLVILVLISLKAIGRLENKYRKFMRGSDSKNIEEIINGYMDKIDIVEKESKELKDICKDLGVKTKSCVQKVSLIRYRAFEDVGSDLSFSVALLDQLNNGFILTGIFGRSESTTYAKPIDLGISRYELSQEENQVLQEAIENKK